MPSQFQLLVDGVDYFAAWSNATASDPYVIPESISITMDADGAGGSAEFEVVQEQTPVAGPWFQTVSDAATVKLMDTSIHKFTIGSLVRAANVVTLTTTSAHNLAVDETIVVSGITTAGFAGTFTVGTVTSSTALTYAHTGTAGTATLGATPLVVGDQALFTGFIGSIDARLGPAGTGSLARVSCKNATDILDRIVLYKGKGTLAGAKNSVVATINLGRNKTDKVMIQTILSTYVTPRLGAGVSNVFLPSKYGKITSTTTINPTKADGNVEIQVGTLRSALDTILELAQARDGKARRYFIDSNRRLVWGFASAAKAGVGYANAPFRIITSGIDNPTGGTATPSTYNPRDLQVSYDHDSSRKRVFILAADSTSDKDTAPDPYVRTYNQTYAITSLIRNTNVVTMTMTDAPGLDVGDSFIVSGVTTAAFNGTFTVGTATSSTVFTYNQTAANATATVGTGVISLPSASGMVTDGILNAATIRVAKRTDQLSNYSRAYFTERFRPLQSINFTVRGRGTAFGQTYGYSGGTVQTGTATYGYVDRWEPGQFCSITASDLGLSGLYRIEEVSIGFESKSFQVKYTITCAKRRTGTLSQLIVSK